MCKKKLQEKDRDIDRLQEACEDTEIKLKMANEIMEEVQHLKAYESEIEQLRGRTQEQEKCIKLMTEQQAQMQQAELTVKEESTRLKKLIDMEKENLQLIQRLHHQELMDKERRLHNTLEEKKKTEIAMYWEEKLLHECGRLKFELEQLHNEEKAFAIEIVRKQNDKLNEHKKNGKKNYKNF